MDPRVDIESNAVGVLVDEGIFPRPVALAAAYRFLERCYVRLEGRSGRRLHVRLEGRERLDASALLGLGGEFGNELVHQLVRHQVSERTEQLRGIMVGRALLSAEPTPARDAAASPAPWDALDFLEDPLGIAVPWEEKHGAKGKAPGRKRK